MYNNIKDFIVDWKEETKATLKIFRSIDNAMKDKKINKNVRDLGKIAWHITQTLTEMPSKANIIPDDVLENKPVPESFELLSEVYNKHSLELTALLQKNWKDSDLLETIELYNQKWKKNKVLSVLIKHQIHHRAQMTIIMRMLDLKVPGIYGPSKEEWTQYGMEPHE